MRILHIFDHSIPHYSGYSFRSLAILKEQKKLGWETFHITSTKQGPSDVQVEEIDNVCFYRTPSKNSIFSAIPPFSYWHVITQLKNRLSEVVKDVKPDLLHAHSPSLNGVAAYQVSKKFNIPLNYEIRAFWEDAAVDNKAYRNNNLRYRLSQKLENYVLRNATHITTICNGLKEDIIQRGISSERITVIPNAVDIEKFKLQCHKSNHLQQSLSIPNNAFVLGFIGSFYPYEGLDFLLNAFEKLSAKYSNLYLLLVGAGPELHTLRSKARKLASSEKILMPGKVPYHEVSDYYSLCDLMLYPRHKTRLTELVTPLKPLEAMAQGKCVVASDVGGHCELITDKKTGFLFKSDDSESIVECISELINKNPEYTQKIANQGYEFVHNQRTWECSVNGYQSAYAKAIQ